MSYTVLGIFGDRAKAEGTIEELENAGYNPKDMSIVVRDNVVAEDIASDTGTNIAGGAVSGATTGAVLGGLAGLLVGVGAIAIPGIGALLIGGPLAAALGLTGAAATTVSGATTGAVAGGLIGALMGLGLPAEYARSYETAIREGGILLAVPALTGQEEEVEDILSQNGADQIRSVKAIDEIPEDVEEPEEVLEPRNTWFRPTTSEYNSPVYAYATSGRKGGRKVVRKAEMPVTRPIRRRARTKSA